MRQHIAPYRNSTHGTPLEKLWPPKDVLNLESALNIGRHASPTGVTMVVMVELHQGCLLDNFLSALGRVLPRWTLPVAVVCFGDAAYSLCHYLRSDVSRRGVLVECVAQHSFQPPPLDAASSFLSPEFRALGWHKAAITEFATRLGAQILFSDIDVVFKRDPSADLAELAPGGRNPRAIAVMASAYTGVNIGLLYVAPEARDMMESWVSMGPRAHLLLNPVAVSTREAKKGMWDQEAFLEVTNRKRRLVDYFLHPRYALCCGGFLDKDVDCRDRKNEMVAQHFVCTKDKVAAMMSFGAWQPRRLSPADCHYRG